MNLLLFRMFIGSKDSERREQRQMKNKVFQFGYAEPHPVLFKDNLIQEQKGTIFPIFLQ